MIGSLRHFQKNLGLIFADQFAKTLKCTVVRVKINDLTAVHFKVINQAMLNKLGHIDAVIFYLPGNRKRNHVCLR